MRPSCCPARRTRTTVTIVDDDYYGSLQFSAPSYQVSENGGYVTIPVIRTGGAGSDAERKLLYPPTARWLFSSGPLPNFVGVTNTLTFNPGEVSKTFNSRSSTTGVTNGPPSNFYFTVNLSLPTRPACSVTRPMPGFSSWTPKGLTCRPVRPTPASFLLQDSTATCMASASRPTARSSPSAALASSTTIRATASSA